MKKLLINLFTAVMLLFVPLMNYGQAPPLGTTSSFALFTAVGAFSNDGASVVTGDIGTDVGSFTGFPPGTVIGDIHVTDPVSVQAAIDVDVAYSALFATTCDVVLGTTLGNSQVLSPNVYCLGAASTLNGDLILDGGGDPDALFIIKIDGALATSTFSNVVLINSASNCNVFWQINGDFDLGESSVFRGTVIANGAITLLEGSSLLGRGLSRGGAIALHNNVVTIAMPPLAATITASGPTTFCEGESVILSGNVDGTWSNGETTASITVTSAGDYFVTNTNGCGTVTSNHIVITVNPLATASVITAGDATTFCEGGSVLLSGNVDGTWSNGETTASITVTTSGDYFVTNTNGCGSVTSNHIVVTVNPLPIAAVITASGPTTFCEGESVILSGNVDGTWSNGETTASITVTSAGDYFVTNTNGCGTVTSNHIVITVNPLATASVITAGDATTFCEGGSVLLSGNVDGTWSNGETTASITVTTSGDYFVTNTNGCGSVTSNHIVVTVNTQPTAAVISAGGPTTFCEGESVVLSGNVDGTWSNGETTASITVTSAGDYFVTNTNGCGTVTSNHIVITVNPLATASVITAGDATTFCEGESVILSGNVDGTWSNGATTASITVSTSGDYFVTNTNGCGSVTSNHILVTVNLLPLAITGVDSTICEGNSVTLGVAPITDHIYLWTPATGLSSATIANPVASPIVTTTYTLTETITATGCENTNPVTITVNYAPEITIQPIDQAACEGSSISFVVTATGTDISYQWRKGTENLVNGGSISGVTTAMLTINPVNISLAASNYNVVITGTCLPSVTSNDVTLDLNTPPTIVTQPADQAVCVGNSAVFSVTATGTELTYQWKKGTVNLIDGGNISGATSATLTINPVNLSDAGSDYHVVLSGSCSGVVTSVDVSLEAYSATSIITEPVDQVACVGYSASFSVTASGADLTYQWRKGTQNLSNGGFISGATSAVLTINPVNMSDAASDYNVVVSGSCSGDVTSPDVSLTVNELPVISTVVCEGSSVSFTASSTSTGLTYQWRKGTVNLIDGDNISGATTSTLTINPVTMADASPYYNVVVSGLCPPDAPSVNISLVVGSAPVIIIEPSDQIACIGEPASFSVDATGPGLTYQWRRGTTILTNGGNISGATSATLTINPVENTDFGSEYNVVITGTCSLTSTSVDVSLSLCVTTGVNTEDDDKVAIIYPNPFKNSLNVIINYSPLFNKVDLNIYNVLGKEVMHRTLTEKTNILDTRNLPVGIYLYRVVVNNKIVQLGKLISEQ